MCGMKCPNTESASMECMHRTLHHHKLWWNTNAEIMRAVKAYVQREKKKGCAIAIKQRLVT